MICFEWNKCKFEIVQVGGGTLSEDIAPHSHSKNSYELHFITGGKGALIADGNETQLKKGDFFITGPELVHAQTSDKAYPIEDIYIYLQTNESRKTNAYSEMFLSRNFCYLENFEPEIAGRIHSEYILKKPDYQSVVSGLLSTLLSCITRTYLPPDFSVNENETNLYDRRFLIVEKYFLYNKTYSLSELSKQLGICERQTQRLLKKYYGKTFREKKNGETG